MSDSMADVLLIKFRISVFGVSKQWMSCSCKVSTNLVSTACDQLNFQKSYFSVAAKRTIFRFNRQGIFEFLPAYDYFVCFFIFVQITPDMIRFFYFAFCEADVVFVKCSVVEYPGQKLQTRLLPAQTIPLVLRSSRLHTEGLKVLSCSSVRSPFFKR